jgi:hypothetical protein
MAANVEKALVTSTLVVNVNGNLLDNEITGGTGNNSLNGAAGADPIDS